VSIATRLKELGIELPPPAAPVGNYVPYVQEGGLVFVSGQVPRGPDGKLQFVGKVGQGLSEQEGYQAARLCALNCIAQVQAALGSLERVKRVVRVGGFVNCTPEFTNQPQVVNGASDLIVQIFGERGKHARAAVGCVSLPGGVAAEVELVVAAE
jgi:enamine deaminase RidA (YjgF/YER057c/UK114 family)